MDANFKDFVECHEGMFDASNDDFMEFLRYVFMAGAFEALMTLRNGVTEGDEGAERYQAYSLEDLLDEAAKASNSFVKAKKKIEVERDYYVGWKSLFHSLRILDLADLFLWATVEHHQYSNWAATAVMDACKRSLDKMLFNLKPICKEGEDLADGLHLLLIYQQRGYFCDRLSDFMWTPKN
jgi:hypothetical protein